MRLALTALFLLTLAIPATAQQHIAPTDPKLPADELKTFKLPPGFEAQLVAADPDIGKPIQLAFDAKARLWVTTSRHYPFAAQGKASDKLYILSDFGPDGKARKVTTFADDLNIPIGVLPLPDCDSCLVSNVGSIIKLTDTDGDGKADKRETILTGFGSDDTHGMMNSFVYLPDGWVYACHGFRNASTIKAKDGSEVKMQSGNTFRFRPDGSRVEPWTFGQVNPFGMTVDPWFNLYTADCHSKPITQLIRGAHYDSFGKPHDGLGYAPHVTRHDHGSTALCGLTWYDADQFPKEYNGFMFLGNVVTNRINCDKIIWKGATPEGAEQPDFLVSSDPWFRPTDIKLGPDGALYFADFYNRIIGHYEVDLKHPLRDKDRGRVWRIVYTGKDGKGAVPKMAFTDLKTEPVEKVDHLLGSPNLTVRLLATQELIRRQDKYKFSKPESDLQFAHRLWLRVSENATDKSSRFLSSDEIGNVHDERVYTAIRENARQKGIKEAAEERKFVNLHGQYARAVVDGIIAVPTADDVSLLVKLLHETPAEDVVLRHAARVALRNCLRDTDGWAVAEKADPAVIADVALGVHDKKAAAFLLKQLQAGQSDPRFYQHVARYGDDAQTTAAFEVLKAKQTEQPAGVLGVQALYRGLQARGAALPAAAPPVIADVCTTALNHADAGAIQAAIDLAGGLKLASLYEPLAKFAGRKDRSDAQRGAALAAQIAIDPAKAAPAIGKLLSESATKPAIRERAVQALAGSNQPAARDALVAALQTAPAKLAGVIATGLAGSPQGAGALLDLVKAGKASALLLQDKAVSTKLLAQDGGRLKPRVDELTKGLPSPDAKTSATIAARGTAFRKTMGDVEKGKLVFTQKCAVCHQLGGQGAKVGPQLDGIGNRGADRLLEDILDPNRNIDAAFRATIVTTLDGRTITGQLVREEGQVLVIVDSNAKEQRIEQKDVDKKATSPISVMPANFDTAIPEPDFYNLLAYLVEQRAKDGAGK
ncbi:PVC-type heme-binding CxxCH protein [Fimbriiglobus ruber]|uniref:Cytochrome c domain-containing protein n=1 Tax=Fimbriiglobus ruber TaxID=1908690 RepID=A0A225E4Z3_9BACT|nr:PVC-type heme-binding CxxCH protein [Fimbriiglobus ruber]OWK45166.1 hypothetical protein FRUB_01497 [Fimbriiglobus ruber]